MNPEQHANPDLHVNPFIAGAPVSGPEMFFGREDVFAFIHNHLIGQHRDTSIVVYGQRRTGKTSVLYQVHRYLDPSYRCVFIDLHRLSLNGMGEFLFGIAATVSRSLRRDHQVAITAPQRAAFASDPRSAFEDLFLDEVMSAIGEDHLVLMLDEVIRLDEEVRAGRLDRQIFDYLRYLMQHQPRLNFIFSLGSGLEEMKRDYAFMFGVALYHRISFLEPAAARHLVTEPARGRYEITPEAIDTILRITSGHPYYTQLVCHCLFDRWVRSAQPVIEAVDVYAVLAESIELGSANLTYVWEDSSPEEKAVMSGLAAAMRSGGREVTASAIRAVWRKAGMPLPERQLSAALRNLDSREVITGEHGYSFSVDLQRLWLDKHRRLDWVKDELAGSFEQWKRQARTTRIRHITVVAVAAIVLGISAFFAKPYLFPSKASQENLRQSLYQLLPGNLSDGDGRCRAAPPPSQWEMPGLVQTLRCTDPGLVNGDVLAYQLESTKDFQIAWQNLNKWWSFHPPGPGSGCPPSGTSDGEEIWNNGLPPSERQSLECGMMSLGSDGTAPTYVWAYPTNGAIIIAQGVPGASFSELKSWLNPPLNTPGTTLTGTWIGSYNCAQGLTGLRLVINAAPGDSATATFNFYPLPSNPGVSIGKFTMTGTYSSRGIHLHTGHWIIRPPDYLMVGLDAGAPTDNGRTLSGTVNSPSKNAPCTNFTVNKAG